VFELGGRQQVAAAGFVLDDVDELAFKQLVIASQEFARRTELQRLPFRHRDQHPLRIERLGAPLDDRAGVVRRKSFASVSMN
jgi:hypothetical protein